MITLGDRLELAREWEAGTYAPTRSGGHPTIYQLGSARWSEADRAAHATVSTWAPWIAVAVGIVVGAWIGAAVYLGHGG